MGTYTHFTLTATTQAGEPVTQDNLGALLQAVERISGYDRTFRLDADEITTAWAAPIKWPDHERHLGLISAAFPDLRLTLFCDGEDGDQWYVYASGGKVAFCGSHRVFAPNHLWDEDEPKPVIWLVTITDLSSYDAPEVEAYSTWDKAQAAAARAAALEWALCHDGEDNPPEMPLDWREAMKRLRDDGWQTFIEVDDRTLDP